MEERPAGVATGAESPATAEPPSSRRRAGGMKRKVNALSTSGSSSTPSKRLTRDKAAIVHSPIHNGPLTRARQGPNSFTGATASGHFGFEEKAAATSLQEMTKAMEEEKVTKLEELEAAMEADFESLRSRDPNVHVVPSHCGWFSWTKVHPLEERVMPSFFNGKSQTRTSDLYMKIRNWIIKKFHSNPNENIELKDLSELEVGDADAKQEVLEFLDYWGLINFHPFPEIDSAANMDDAETAKKDLLLENLFHFESVQPYQSATPKPNITTPAMPSGLFPDSAIAEDLLRPEGPSVDYHCNSCSADCSRKRYHCQKQADYDLCADCFNNGKFGSNMSSSDFILMEPAEIAGASGGKWTDQETLLLLEALELYKENWNEIAEHVATKTKAQCILHFLQMPIEDAFLDSVDDIEGGTKETADLAVTTVETSGSKILAERSDGKNGSNEDQPTSPLEASKLESAGEVKVSDETRKLDNVADSGKSEISDKCKAGQDLEENLALKALTEAFEAVGYLPMPGNQLSFAEVGNPVMALAAFMARLVGPDIATASARTSLKSLSSKSPGLQLAARHCFLLEDPPDDVKDQIDLHSATEMADHDVQNDNQNDKCEKNNSSNEDSDLEENITVDSSNAEVAEKVTSVNEEGTAVTCEKLETGESQECEDSKLLKDGSTSTLKESNETPSKSDCHSNSKDLLEEPSLEKHSQTITAAKVVDEGTDLKQLEKYEPSPSITLVSVEEPAKHVTSKNVDMGTDSLPLGKKVKHPQEKGVPNDIDMSSSQASEAGKSQQAHMSSSIGVDAGEDQKRSKSEKPACKQIKDDNMDKLKRAAVAAISAAAVKAKFLANQEEDQIKQLAISLIEKQLYKLELKLSFFHEMENMIMRVREQLERSKQRLFHERAQIIAARLGVPASASRQPPSSLPANRIAMNFANTVQRPPMGMAFQRPLMSRPLGTLAPNANQFISTSTAGSSIGPSGQDKFSSVGTK
ncbi:hypothetical protein K2173_013619 [Erythroxylum novogranatense]|uniref:SWI/SNF complex subunit SWI3D n=1 Tax=Erythroxylum novogranatense TaxID=1862640 RepID=A0AAV8TK55_9ROSI|nr:hypothetical protein K2173_013619 [Erythroxylum novogranatense]